MIKLLIEAFVVGVILVIVGTFTSMIVGKLFSTDLPPACKDWNKNYVMEICLFLSGALTHLIFEFVGGNKWYCKNGYACK